MVRGASCGVEPINLIPSRAATNEPKVSDYLVVGDPIEDERDALVSTCVAAHIAGGGRWLSDLGGEAYADEPIGSPSPVAPQTARLSCRAVKALAWRALPRSRAVEPSAQ